MSEILVLILLGMLIGGLIVSHDKSMNGLTIYLVTLGLFTLFIFLSGR